MPPSSLVELVAAYKEDTHATVWKAIASVLVSVDNMLLGASGDKAAALREDFSAFAARLVVPAAEKV